MRKEVFDKIQKTAKRLENQFGYAKKQPLKEMTMREMLRITRAKQVAEEAEVLAASEPKEKQLSGAEQEQHQRNMQDYFDEDNITIKFEPILVYDDGVFWAGTLDGQLKFAYIVTPAENNSGVKIERSPDFDPSNEDNQRIEKKIVDYYQNFRKYWSNNELEN